MLPVSVTVIAKQVKTAVGDQLEEVRRHHIGSNGNQSDDSCYSCVDIGVMSSTLGRLLRTVTAPRFAKKKGRARGIRL